MKQSELFTKTIKELPKDEESRNAQLLIKAGYIQKEMSGVYAFLPLGLKVLNKIIQIIREEMDSIGGQEISLSALQNPEIWQKTDRWSDKNVDAWFKTKLASGAEVGLGFTHEEPLTNIMRSYVQSYKDLPQYVYQFQTKFRNEARAKSGLMRTREFIMKDLYSFTVDQKALDEFYELAKEAYLKIFQRLGLGEKTFVTFASGGVFSKYSHEFQTECLAGEDTIYVDYEKKIAVNKEVYNDEVLAELGLDKEKLKTVKAIEVGNIFKLGTKFSEPLGLFYTDEAGNKKPVIMGCYGIGPARVLATIVELYNDEKGIVWPKSIAPFTAHLLCLGDDPEVKKQAESVYQSLIKEGIEVLFDDRIGLTAGEMFADADLVGLPYRLIVSKKNGDKIEIKERQSANSESLDLNQVIKKIKENV
ncbi:MAG: prolyl-tRNA synthetase [Candidatus Buchananbacteria bacterium]|nr:prolyl-tRNA synthetase [Candidatus Buchananbacteria bacterium]